MADKHFHRRHRRARRSRQERAGPRADRHRSRPAAGGKGARHHDRPRLRAPRAARRAVGRHAASSGSSTCRGTRISSRTWSRASASVDVALFVVAADDGWMPQTEEHLQILAYLGVRRAVVALTKIDLAPSPCGRRGRRARGAAILAVRGRADRADFGRHRPGFRRTQRPPSPACSPTRPPPPDIGKPRLPIDRVFALRGIGTVVTGTLTGGALRRGEAVVAQPSGRAAPCPRVQNHGRDAETACPARGRRSTCRNSRPRATRPSDAARSITLPELGGPADALDVLLTRADERTSAGQRSIRTAAKRQ